MGNGSSRIASVLLSLILGFVAGLVIGPRFHGREVSKTMNPPVTPPPPKSWNIKVGSDPCNLNDDDDGGKKATWQTVTKSLHNIKWHADSKMYIVLHVPYCENNPFPNATLLPNKDHESRSLYLIGDGTTNSVDSGKVNQNACSSDSGDQDTWIKYDQCIQYKNGPFLCCDGWIIIKP
jgi:hypothetical protein